MDDDWRRISMDKYDRYRISHAYITHYQSLPFQSAKIPSITSHIKLVPFKVAPTPADSAQPLNAQSCDAPPVQTSPETMPLAFLTCPNAATLGPVVYQGPL